MTKFLTFGVDHTDGKRKLLLFNGKAEALVYPKDYKWVTMSKVPDKDVSTILCTRTVAHKYGQVEFHSPLILLGEVKEGYKVVGLPRVTWLEISKSGDLLRCDYDMNFCLGEPVFLQPHEDVRITLETFVNMYLENWIADIKMQMNMYKQVSSSLGYV